MSQQLQRYNKLIYGGGAGAVVTLIVFLIGAIWPDIAIPAEVQSAATTLIVAVVVLLAPANAEPEPEIKTANMPRRKR